MIYLPHIPHNASSLWITANPSSNDLSANGTSSRHMQTHIFNLYMSTSYLYIMLLPVCTFIFLLRLICFSPSLPIPHFYLILPLLAHFLTTPSSHPAPPSHTHTHTSWLKVPRQMFQFRSDLYCYKTKPLSLENKFIQTVFCMSDRGMRGKEKEVMNEGRQMSDLPSLHCLCLKW